MEEVTSYIKQAFSLADSQDSNALFTPSTVFHTASGTTRTRREIGLRVRDLVLALARALFSSAPKQKTEGGRVPWPCTGMASLRPASATGAAVHYHSPHS